MTPQEAIKLVEQCGLNIEGVKNIECESLIISALEKQIPKKPVNVTHFVNSTSGNCPVCNGRLLNVNYCQRCGQALDWSDTE